MKQDDKMVVKRRFEKIYNMMKCKSYIKSEDFSENKERFTYGFKHIKTDKIDNYILIACELDEICENIKLFNFWSDKFIKEAIEKRKFQKKGWLFMTLVERNCFFIFKASVFKRCNFQKNSFFI